MPMNSVVVCVQSLTEALNKLSLINDFSYKHKTVYIEVIAAYQNFVEAYLPMMLSELKISPGAQYYNDHHFTIGMKAFTLEEQERLKKLDLLAVNDVISPDDAALIIGGVAKLEWLLPSSTTVRWTELVAFDNDLRSDSNDLVGCLVRRIAVGAGLCFSEVQAQLTRQGSGQQQRQLASLVQLCQTFIDSMGQPDMRTPLLHAKKVAEHKKNIRQLINILSNPSALASDKLRDFEEQFNRCSKWLRSDTTVKTARQFVEHVSSELMPARHAPDSSRAFARRPGFFGQSFVVNGDSIAEQLVLQNTK